MVLAARCHEDEAGLPYAPIVELLSDAVRTSPGWLDALPPQRLADASLLLPELAAAPGPAEAPLPLDGPGAQVRLLEGVAAVLDAACGGPAPGRAPRRRPRGRRGHARRPRLPRTQARRPVAAAAVVLAQRGGTAGSSASPARGGPGARRGAHRSARPAEQADVSALVRRGRPGPPRRRLDAARLSRERGPAAVRRRVSRGSARGERAGAEALPPEVRTSSARA